MKTISGLLKKSDNNTSSTPKPIASKHYNYYEILGVQETASDQEILDAFLNRSEFFKPIQIEWCGAINEAFYTLYITSRKDYDNNKTTQSLPLLPSDKPKNNFLNKKSRTEKLSTEKSYKKYNCYELLETKDEESFYAIIEESRRLLHDGIAILDQQGHLGNNFYYKFLYLIINAIATLDETQSNNSTIKLSQRDHDFIVEITTKARSNILKENQPQPKVVEQKKPPEQFVSPVEKAIADLLDNTGEEAAIQNIADESFARAASEAMKKYPTSSPQPFVIICEAVGDTIKQKAIDDEKRLWDFMNPSATDSKDGGPSTKRKFFVIKNTGGSGKFTESTGHHWSPDIVTYDENDKSTITSVKASGDRNTCGIYTILQIIMDDKSFQDLEDVKWVMNAVEPQSGVTLFNQIQNYFLWYIFSDAISNKKKLNELQGKFDPLKESLEALQALDSDQEIRESLETIFRNFTKENLNDLYNLFYEKDAYKQYFQHAINAIDATWLRIIFDKIYQSTETPSIPNEPKSITQDVELTVGAIKSILSAIGINCIDQIAIESEEAYLKSAREQRVSILLRANTPNPDGIYPETKANNENKHLRKIIAQETARALKEFTEFNNEINRRALGVIFESSNPSNKKGKINCSRVQSINDHNFLHDESLGIIKTSIANNEVLLSSNYNFKKGIFQDRLLQELNSKFHSIVLNYNSMLLANGLYDPKKYPELAQYTKDLDTLNANQIYSIETLTIFLEKYNDTKRQEIVKAKNDEDRKLKEDSNSYNSNISTSSSSSSTKPIAAEQAEASIAPKTTESSSNSDWLNSDSDEEKNDKDKKKEEAKKWQEDEVSAAFARTKAQEIRDNHDRGEEGTISSTEYDIKNNDWITTQNPPFGNFWEKNYQPDYGHNSVEKKSGVKAYHLKGINPKRSQEDTDCIEEITEIEFTEETAVQTLYAAIKQTETEVENNNILDPNEYLNADECGSTLTAALEFVDSIDGKRKLAVANLGDSRTYVVRDGKLIPLTKDHNPNDPQNPNEETQRILANGGNVWFNRVNGNLAVARAIGDTSVFQNISGSHTPDITLYNLQDDDLVLQFCDGVLEGNALSDGKIETIIKHYLEKENIDDIPEAIIMAAFRNRSTDNISVLLSEIGKTKNPKLTAIFDGHGGDEVAKYLAENFGRIVKEQAITISNAQTENKTANTTQDLSTPSTSEQKQPEQEQKEPQKQIIEGDKITIFSQSLLDNSSKPDVLHEILKSIDLTQSIDKNGNTLLLLMVQQKEYKVVEAILKINPNLVKICNNEGLSAIDILVDSVLTENTQELKNTESDTIDLLINACKEADVLNMLDRSRKDGLTPILKIILSYEYSTLAPQDAKRTLESLILAGAQIPDANQETNSEYQSLIYKWLPLLKEFENKKWQKNFIDAVEDQTNTQENLINLIQQNNIPWNYDMLERAIDKGYNDLAQKMLEDKNLPNFTSRQKRKINSLAAQKENNQILAALLPITFDPLVDNSELLDACNGNKPAEELVTSYIISAYQTGEAAVVNYIESQHKPIVENFKASLESQAKISVPKYAYYATGLLIDVGEIDGRTLVKIDKVLAPELARFYENDPRNKLSAEQIEEFLANKFITKIYYGENREFDIHEKFAGKENTAAAMAELMAIFHSLGTIKFDAISFNENDEEIPHQFHCEVSMKSVFINTSFTESKVDERLADGSTIVLYDAKKHGVGEKVLFNTKNTQAASPVKIILPTPQEERPMESSPPHTISSRDGSAPLSPKSKTKTT